MKKIIAAVVLACMMLRMVSYSYHLVDINHDFDRAYISHGDEADGQSENSTKIKNKRKKKKK